MQHKTLTLTFCVSLWDPTRNYIGLCQSKVYRMSTMAVNLYVVHKLCITEAEWAPSKFYIRHTKIIYVHAIFILLVVLGIETKSI